MSLSTDGKVKEGRPKFNPRPGRGLNPVSQGFRPPGICPPPPPPEIPSDLALPGVRSLGIWPPLKFRDFAPPFLHFRSSYFLYIIGVKNNGRKLGNFDTCTNYSRCSQRNTLISCRLCVRGSAKCIFIFCEFRWIANMKFKKKSFSSFVEFELFLLKTN